MPFKEGESGNPVGRKKGSENKVTSKVKQAFTDLLEENLPQLKKDVKKMTPNNRAYYLLNLAEYILPKLSRAQVEANTANTTTVLIQWTDSDNKQGV